MFAVKDPPSEGAKTEICTPRPASQSTDRLLNISPEVLAVNATTTRITTAMANENDETVIGT